MKTNKVKSGLGLSGILGCIAFGAVIAVTGAYVKDYSIHRQIEERRAEYNRIIEKLDDIDNDLPESQRYNSQLVSIKADSLLGEISELERKLILFYRSE